MARNHDVFVLSYHNDKGARMSVIYEVVIELHPREDDENEDEFRKNSENKVRLVRDFSIRTRRINKKTKFSCRLRFRRRRARVR